SRSRDSRQRACRRRLGGGHLAPRGRVPAGGFGTAVADRVEGAGEQSLTVASALGPVAELHLERDAQLRAELALFAELAARPGEAAPQLQKQPLGRELAPEDQPRGIARELDLVVCSSFDLRLPREPRALTQALKKREL